MIALSSRASSRARIVARLVAAVASGLVGMAHAADDPKATLVEVRGVRLYVQRHGSGPPIVFLHGGAHAFESSFAAQRDDFAATRTVIGIDQRGHGRSPDTDRPFDYGEMAEDTAALIGQLGLGPVDVVGLSDGGNVGLLLAARHPTLVRRLVVSGANLRGDLAGPAAVERMGAMPIEQLSARMPPSFRTDYERMSPDGAAHWLVHLEKSRRLWLTPVVVEPAELAKIKIPVLVMAGDHDFAPIEHTLEIYRALPAGQLYILPATGHGTMDERPEEVDATIRRFLR
jgi:pimeloyl-ACP methyl ester carboxylesterase